MNSFDRRLRSFSIDTAMIFLIMLLLIPFQIDQKYLKFIIIGVYFLPNCIFYLFGTGQTFGKRIQKVKVVKYKPGNIIADYEIPIPLFLILREITKGVLIILSFGLYLFIAGIISTNNREGRTIHDFIFKTRVIAVTEYTSDLYEFRNKTESMNKSLEGYSHDK